MQCAMCKKKEQNVISVYNLYSKFELYVSLLSRPIIGLSRAYNKPCCNTQTGRNLNLCDLNV